MVQPKKKKKRLLTSVYLLAVSITNSYCQFADQIFLMNSGFILFSVIFYYILPWCLISFVPVLIESQLPSFCETAFYQHKNIDHD